MTENELRHHGIIGQKWGVRRFQNPDGSLTAAGKKRYVTDDGKHLTEAGQKKDAKLITKELNKLEREDAKAYLNKDYKYIAKDYNLRRDMQGALNKGKDKKAQKLQKKIDANLPNVKSSWENIEKRQNAINVGRKWIEDNTDYLIFNKDANYGYMTSPFTTKDVWYNKSDVRPNTARNKKKYDKKVNSFWGNNPRGKRVTNTAYIPIMV